MERLTKRVGCGEAVPVAEGDICIPSIRDGRCKTGVMIHSDGRYGYQRHCNDECALGKLIDRLAAYEDNAQTPEEQAAMIVEHAAQKRCLEANAKNIGLLKMWLHNAQVKLDEARAVAREVLKAYADCKRFEYPEMDEILSDTGAVDRLRRIAADEPAAADRLMQERLGGKHGKG